MRPSRRTGYAALSHVVCFRMDERGSDVGDGDTPLRGALWATASPLSRSLLQFAGNIILARLLLPEEFGAAAIALAITMFGTLFTELGIYQAVVQRETVDQAFLSTAFWLNAGTGLIAAAGTVGLSRLLDHFYQNAPLRNLTAVASLGLVLSVGVVHQAMLDRRFQFRLVAYTDAAAAVVGLTVSIGLAVAGAGSMALVAGPTAGIAVRSLLLWRNAGWMPSATFNGLAIRELWNFARHLVAGGVVMFAARAADVLVLGRIATAAEVGLYQRGLNFGTLPSSQLASPINRVLLAELSRRHTAQDQSRDRALRGAITVTLIMSLPLAFLGSWFSEAAIVTVYGANWANAGRIASVAVWLVPSRLIRTTFLSAVTAIGHTRIALRSNLITGAATVACILGGAAWGAIGVISGLVVAEVLGTAIGGVLTWNSYRPRWTAPDTAHALRVIAGACAFGLAVAFAHAQPSVARTVTVLALGAVAYVLVVRPRRLWKTYFASSQSPFDLST